MYFDLSRTILTSSIDIIQFLGEVFYFPHNMDFRGRAYPVPPHLNHIGDDLSRGLLKFGESRPLGESGLRWLKIHLSNLYGYDKASFTERVEFTMTHLDDIYDSAEKPLDVSQAALSLTTCADHDLYHYRVNAGGPKRTILGNV